MASLKSLACTLLLASFTPLSALAAAVPEPIPASSDKTVCPSPFVIKIEASNKAIYYVDPYRTTSTRAGEQGRVSQTNVNGTFSIDSKARLLPLNGPGFTTDPQRYSYWFPRGANDAVYFVTDAYFSSYGSADRNYTGNVITAEVKGGDCELRLSSPGSRETLYFNENTSGVQSLFIQSGGSSRNGYLQAKKLYAVAPLK